MLFRILNLFLDQVDDETLASMIPSTTMLFTTNMDEDVMSYEDEIAEALDHNYAAMINEHMIIGVERFIAETEQHEMFSYTFAGIFVLIAVLIVATSMARLVERQRVQIGTLNAMGMAEGKIARHYISYSLLLSLLGAVPGFFVGIYGMARYMVSMFSSYYVIPAADASYDGRTFAVIAVTVLACAAASWFACRKILRIPPAEALRPAAPKKAKESLIERLPFLNRLGFASRYNLRDLSRAKFRALMGIVGTACGMLCAVFAFGCIGLVGDIDGWFFERMQNFAYEAIVSEDPDTEWLEDTTDAVNGELVMQSAIELSKVGKNVLSADKTTQTLTVIEGKGLYRLTDPTSEVMELSPGQIAITYRLALLLIIGLWNRIRTFSPAYVQALLFLEVMNWYDGIVIDKIWVGYSRFWDIPGVGLPYVQTWPQVLKKRGILTVIWIAGAAIVSGLVVLVF